MIKRFLVFNLTSLFLLILATRTATILHEVIGHGLVGYLLGGDQLSIKVSLFGGGETLIDFYEPLSSLEHFAFSMGGIIINLASGAIVFLSVMKLKKMNQALKLFLIFFAGSSIIGALHYTIIGSYYGVGDPASWIISDVDEFISKSLWWILLLPLSIVSYLFVTRYIDIISTLFSYESFLQRLTTIIFTLGVTLGAYSLLFFSFEQKLYIVDTPKISKEKAIEEVRQRKYEEMKRINPAEEINLDQIPVSSDEVKIPQPLTPFLIFIYLLATGFGLLVWKDGERAFTKINSLPLKDCLYTGLLAMLVITVILKLFY